VLDDAFTADATARGAGRPTYSAILVTGDLVQDDRSGYLRFKSILGNLQKPVLCVPGNHDEPERCVASLSEAPFQYCGVRNIARGSSSCWIVTIRGTSAAGSRRASLPDSTPLSRKSPAHALVCLHHHPGRDGQPWLDGIGLAMRGVLARHRCAPHVRGIVWGHVPPGLRRRAQRRASVRHTLDGRAISAAQRSLRASTPAARVPPFRLLADGTIHSEVRWISPPLSPGSGTHRVRAGTPAVLRVVRACLRWR